jgi:hypothetical protein
MRKVTLFSLGPMLCLENSFIFNIRNLFLTMMNIIFSLVAGQKRISSHFASFFCLGLPLIYFIHISRSALDCFTTTTDAENLICELFNRCLFAFVCLCVMWMQLIQKKNLFCFLWKLTSQFFYYKFFTLKNWHKEPLLCALSPLSCQLAMKKKRICIIAKLDSEQRSRRKK